MSRKNLENAIWRRIPKSRREYIDGQRAIPGENKPLSSMSKSTLEIVAKVYGVPGYDDSMKIEQRRSDGSRVGSRRKAHENPIELPLFLLLLGAGAAVTGGVVYVAIKSRKSATATPTVAPAPDNSAANAASASAAASAAIAAASANAGTVAQNLVTTAQNAFLASLPAATQSYTFAGGTQINLNIGDTLNLLAPISAQPGMLLRFLITPAGGGLQTRGWNATPDGASEALGLLGGPAAGTFKAVAVGQFQVTLDQITQGTNPPNPPVGWAQTLSVSISSGAALTLGP